jgi:hypothetical protein
MQCKISLIEKHEKIALISKEKIRENKVFD